MKTLRLIMLLIIVGPGMYAQPGTLDPLFGTGGMVRTNIATLETGSEYTKSVVQQADGKILVATQNLSQARIYRFNADGTPDYTFGQGLGYNITGLRFESLKVNAIGLQPDGKIILLGTGSVHRDFLVARFNSDGSADATFGNGNNFLNGPHMSFTAVDISYDDEAVTFAVQSDGKIVVVGKVHMLYDEWAVVRYNANGTEDTSFDGDGIAIVNPRGDNDYAKAVAIQSDGKILIAGSSYDYDNSNNDFCVARLNSAGGLDPTFNSTGKVYTNIYGPTSNDAANAMTIQADGKIVLAGKSEGPGGQTFFALARYNTDGSLDTGFDGDGKLTTVMGSGTPTDEAVSLMLQADGKLIAAGPCNAAPDIDFGVARYNSDGSLDVTFDGDGKVITPVLAGNDIMTSATLQSNGMVLTVGYVRNASGFDNLAVARYTGSGNLDTGFDGDGIMIAPWKTPSTDWGYTMAVQSDGKVIMAGNATVAPGSASHTALVRYNTDGSLDNTFNGTGKANNALGAVTQLDLRSVLVQPDGKIIIAGSGSVAGNADFVIARYNATGTLDATFDGDGWLTTAIGTDNDAISALALQPDGKIVAVGYAYLAAGFDIVVARYNTDGSLDVTFDGDGKVITSIYAGGDQATSVAILSDGKILVGGIAGGSNNDFTLLRYNTDGSLDNTFDGDGIVTTDVGGGSDVGYKMALQGDGKILLAGFSNGVGNSSAIVRYNTDGTLDPTFAGDGILPVLVGNIRGLALQDDGKIVAAGTNIVSSINMFSVARYNTDGSIDNTFGTSGYGNYGIAGLTNMLYGMKLYGNRIYLGGYVIVAGSTNDFEVMALVNDGVPLPISLMAFSGKLYNGDALLEWKTSGETPGSVFEIERSLDTRMFSPVGKVAAIGTLDKQVYHFTDPQVAALNVRTVYYRLKTVNPDGKYTYSTVLPLSLTKSASVLLYPNPTVKGRSSLVINAVKEAKVSCRIMDYSGRVVQQTVFSLSEGSNALPIDMSGFADGFYAMALSGSGLAEHIVFVKK